MPPPWVSRRRDEGGSRWFRLRLRNQAPRPPAAVADPPEQLRPYRHRRRRGKAAEGRRAGRRRHAGPMKVTRHAAAEKRKHIEHYCGFVFLK